MRTHVGGLGLFNDVAVLAEPDVDLVGHDKHERVAAVDARGARLDEARLTVATTCTTTYNNRSCTPVRTCFTGIVQVKLDSTTCRYPASDVVPHEEVCTQAHNNEFSKGAVEAFADNRQFKFYYTNRIFF